MVRQYIIWAANKITIFGRTRAFILKTETFIKNTLLSVSCGQNCKAKMKINLMKMYKMTNADIYKNLFAIEEAGFQISAHIGYC